MVRTVAWLLILSVLALNEAWAMDNCTFGEPSGSGADVMEPLGPAPADTTSTVPTCNRWCAGWLHLAVLPGSPVLSPIVVPAGFDARPRADLYIFLPAAPPTHPPTA